jgi:hypothetical protein
MLAVAIFDVDALVVEALDVLKLEVVPQRVVMVARTEFRIFEKKLLPARFPVTVRLLAVVEASVEDPETVRFVLEEVAEIEVEALVVEAFTIFVFSELITDKLVKVPEAAEIPLLTTIVSTLEEDAYVVEE